MRELTEAGWSTLTSDWKRCGISLKALVLQWTIYSWMVMVMMLPNITLPDPVIIFRLFSYVPTTLISHNTSSSTHWPTAHPSVNCGEQDTPSFVGLFPIFVNSTSFSFNFLLSSPVSRPSASIAVPFPCYAEGNVFVLEFSCFIICWDIAPCSKAKRKALRTRDHKGICWR